MAVRNRANLNCTFLTITANFVSDRLSIQGRKRTFLKEMGNERDGVGFPLGISSFPLIGFRFRPEGREWSRFIVDYGRLKGGQVSHIPLTRSCWLVKYLEIYTRVDKNRCPSISAFTRGFLYRTKLIYHTYTVTLSQDTLQP